MVGSSRNARLALTARCVIDRIGLQQQLITMKVSLAAPLEYPRGCPIPFEIKISSADNQLIDLFAVSSNILSAELHRKVLCHTALPSSFDEIVGRGTYWISARTPSALYLAGETHASAIVQPSLQHFNLALQVCALPLSALASDAS